MAKTTTSNHADLEQSPNANGKKSKTKSTRSAIVNETRDSEDVTEDMPSRVEELTPSAAPDMRKRKKSRAGKEPEALQESVGVQKKDKKRKRREGEKDPLEHGEDSFSAEPAKKKHKNRTDFADPRDDGSLNSQSRKALEYAFMQMNKPKKWKFNKARQNWIVRNIWSPEALPDIYFPLALKYLSKTQGGSREKLKEICHHYLKAGDDLVEQVESSKLAELSTTETKAATKSGILKTRPTPGPLIAGAKAPVPTPGALIATAETATTSETPVPVSASKTGLELTASRRSRAQKLLDVLSASEET